MLEKLLQKYSSRLKKQGLIKSLIWGVLIGLVALLVSATIFWIIGVKQVWWCAIIFVGVSSITLPIFYVWKFRPTKKDVARRVDDLGLQERVLTMSQYENDDSSMASIQRKDGVEALSRVHDKMLKFSLKKSFVVTLSVTAAVSLTMTTLSALAAAGIIRTGGDIIDTIVNPPKEYTVTYRVEGEGEIVGGDRHEVVEGEDAPKVTAVPKADWAFLEWSDGVKTPYRFDENVIKDINVTAIFTPLDGGDESEPEDEEQATDLPFDYGEQSQQPPSGSPSPKYEMKNQVFNGKTYYGGSTYEHAYKDALEEITKDDSMSSDEKSIIGKYFEVIEKGE